MEFAIVEFPSQFRNDEQRRHENMLFLRATTTILPPQPDIYSKGNRLDVKILGMDRYNPDINALYFEVLDNEEAYSEMFERMNRFHKAVCHLEESRSLRCDIKSGSHAVGFISSTGSYSRVRIEEDVDDDKDSVWCSLIDYPVERSCIPIEKLSPLQTFFCVLPSRIFQFRLKHLQHYTGLSILKPFMIQLNLSERDLTVEFTGEQDEEMKDGRRLGWLWDSHVRNGRINEMLLKSIFNAQSVCVPLGGLNSWFYSVAVVGVTKDADVYLQNQQTAVYTHLMTELRIFQENCNEYSDCTLESLQQNRMYLTKNSNGIMKRVLVQFPIIQALRGMVRLDYVDAGVGDERPQYVRPPKLFPAPKVITLFPAQVTRAKLFGIEDISPNVLIEIAILYKGFPASFSAFVAEQKKDEGGNVKYNFVILLYDKLPRRLLVGLPSYILEKLAKGYSEMIGKYFNHQIQIVASQYFEESKGQIADNCETLKELCFPTCSATSVIPVTWQNPKFVSGSELTVTIEDVEACNIVTIIENEDWATREKISEALREMRKNKMLMNISVTLGHLELTKGEGIYMVELAKDDVSRATVIKWTTVVSEHPPHEVSVQVIVYLIDYGRYHRMPLCLLRHIIQTNLSRYPPMTMKATIINNVESDERKTLKATKGEVIKVRIVDTIAKKVGPTNLQSITVKLIN